MIEALTRKVLEKVLIMDMPGESYKGPMDSSEEERELSSEVRGHVTKLAEEIGIRNTSYPDALEEAAKYIEDAFRDLGLPTESREFVTSHGHHVRNIEASLPSSEREAPIVVGAHYDTVDCPGVNDNGSGVAALLVIARIVAEKPSMRSRGVRLVAFVNEEPPYFRTDDMGRLVYAHAIWPLVMFVSWG
ncbi:M28 family peptidase [Thermodesulfobacteriota bacterium]